MARLFAVDAGLMALALILSGPAAAIESHRGSAGTLACDWIFGDGSESERLDTDLVADAGADAGLLPGQTLALDGSASSSSSGGVLNHCWSVTGPVGSRAQLNDRSAVQPLLATDLAGDYRVRLIVDDGSRLSEQDTAVVSAREVSELISAVQGGVVTTPDRTTSLSIPAGALDSDTVISIRALGPDEYPAQAQGADPWRYFEFQPDGLTFNVPATLTVEVNDRIPGVTKRGDGAHGRGQLRWVG